MEADARARVDSGVGGVSGVTGSEICSGPRFKTRLRQDYLGKKELRRPRIELDETEANKRGRYGTIIGKRRRRSADETRDAVLALSEEGFVRGVISKKLGVSESVVRRYQNEMPSSAETGAEAA